VHIVSLKDVALAMPQPQTRSAERLLMSHLSFDLMAGENLAILGPNGSGKTTILNLIRGIKEPSRGTVRVQASDEEVAHMPQDYRLALFPWLTFGTHPILYGNFPNGFDDETFDEAVEAFGLAGLRNQPVYSLSGGEQQLLLLSSIMSCRASLYLMDEPFSAVDIKRKGAAIEFVHDRIRDLSASVIFVTHNIQDVGLLASKVLIVSGVPDVVPQLYERQNVENFEETIRDVAGI
jgi:ABC-type nitrate/sulfonate/bicarbonate transport system ATPase subunit